MAGWRSEERVRLPVAHQQWRSLAFVHFSYPPEVIAPLLPDGVVPDTFDGLAWVGITPFLMRSSVVPVLPRPRVPVGEVNVRTYVRDRDGVDAIWFLSLELDQLAVAVGLRTLMRLPYRWAEVDVEHLGPTLEAGRVRYESKRRPPHRTASFRLELVVGDELAESEVGPFETFLVGRWRAHTMVFRRQLSVPVQHPPWTLHEATLVTLEQDLLSAVGLPPPSSDPHLLFSPGVDVRLGFPRPS